MIQGRAEYVILRLARRFLFGYAFLLRFGRFIPYYRTNANQSDAAPVVDLYASAIARAGLPVAADRVLLEIGSGATNSVGYELLRRQVAGAQGHVYLFEPHVALDAGADLKLREGIAKPLLSRLERITSLEQVAPGSIDVVLSSSVLEHVTELDALLASLRRVIKPGGCMIHAVDYRDHFFKYPYHFLTFGAPTWERWLNPGDLPRWRLGGHLKAFAEHGFSTRVLDQQVLQEAFDQIRSHVSSDFDADDPAVAVASALLLSVPSAVESPAKQAGPQAT